jgi:hypothetical protein
MHFEKSREIVKLDSDLSMITNNSLDHLYSYIRIIIVE